MTILAFVIVGLIRLVFNGFRLSFGTGYSRSNWRHTEHVLRKTLTVSIFTAIMVVAVLAIFWFSAAAAMTAVYAWPVLFVVEFAWRQVRSSRIMREEAQRRLNSRHTVQLSMSLLQLGPKRLVKCECK